MPPRLLITGAPGYIGARLVALARQGGCDVVVLGSRPPGDLASAEPRRLGEEPPPATPAGATALLHLGHSWTSDAAGVERFVSASTT